MGIFGKLMTAVQSRDLLSALEAGEEMAALKSREKQKAFCVFAEDCIRKIYMISHGMESISDVPDAAAPLLSSLAAGAQDLFCRKTAVYLDNASAMIDRNVNAKIVFCDLVDRIYMTY